MNLSSQLNPIQIKRGFIAVSIPDWSQVGNNQAVYDFSAANVTKAFRQVAGLWCDNTNNTNSITVTVGGSNQIFKVYGGEQATFPVFTTDYPRITVVNNNDVTANVGTSQIIFTDFDIGFNIAQTGSGASIVVSDTNLLSTLIGNGGTVINGGVANVTSANMLGGNNGLTGSSQIFYRTIMTGPGYLDIGAGAYNSTQLSLAAGNQIIMAQRAANQSWWIQNISSDPVFIGFGNSSQNVASSTNGYMLAAGATISTSQLWGRVYRGIITACPTNAGDKINLWYA